jgi:hypothetical protein
MQLDGRIPAPERSVSTSVILRKRTAYEDWEETERKRHLLRLWLARGSGPPAPAGCG